MYSLLLLTYVFPLRYAYPRIGKQERKQASLNFPMPARFAKSKKMFVLCSYNRTERQNIRDERNEMAGKTRGSGEKEKEWKHCILTEQHVNDCVFLRLLGSALKHENVH